MMFDVFILSMIGVSMIVGAIASFWPQKQWEDPYPWAFRDYHRHGNPIPNDPNLTGLK